MERIPRLVLDTNIVMDLLHFADRRTEALRTAIEGGRVRCFTDRPCLAELERVTGYLEFGLDAPARDLLIKRYLSFVTVCDPDAEANGEANGEADYALPRCRDEDDQKFLILAVRCAAGLLITRDKLLLKLAHHRHKPPPFAILTAQAAICWFDISPESV